MSRILLPLAAALVLSAGHALGQEAPDEAFRLDCRYTRPSTPSTAPAHTAFLPDDDLFGPLVADPREPRFLLGVRRERFKGPPFATAGGSETITMALISAGGYFGVVGRRQEDGCNGFQLGMYGGAASQFNEDAQARDLINTDFIIGGQLTTRLEAFATRLRVYHQSSHFGDEFLVHNPSVAPTEFGFEAFDLLLSLDGSGWRVYAGGGYMFFAFGEPDSKLAQAGIELRKRSDDGGFRPIAAADVTAMSSRQWGRTHSVVAGFEWTSPAAVRRMRALVVYLDGFTPYGQSLRTQKVRGFGLQAQFDF